MDGFETSENLEVNPCADIDAAIIRLEQVHAFVNTLFDAIQTRRTEIIAEEKALVQMFRDLMV